MENRNTYLPLLFGLVLAIGVALGYIISPKGSGGPTSFSRSDFDKIDDILYYLDREYYDSIDRDKMVTGAIDKIFDQLDAHSTYFPPRDLERAEEGMRGSLEGIGVQFNVLDDTIQVINTVKGGPAESVGVLAGDKIVMIDDSTAVGVTDQMVLKRLKGPKRSKVKVGIIRGLETEIREFVITRDVIPIRSIDPYYMIDDNVGYIRMTTFGHKTYEEFMAAMRELKTMGMEKLIFDLKGNGGGLINTARDIADEFLDGNKLIVYTKERGGERTDYSARRKGIFEEGELIILMDGGSASASEILAGALQAHGRAKVVGWRSYGKGTVQQQFDFGDGSAMRLTVAKYYLPNGNSIDKNFKKNEWSAEQIQEWMFTEKLPDSISWGIQPDIFVKIDTSEIGKLKLLLQGSQLTRLFAYHYYPRHVEEFKKYQDFDDFQSRFRVDNKILDKFDKYLVSKEVEVDSLELGRIQEYVKTSIKAHMAKQCFDDRALFKILNTQDQIFESAYDNI